MHSARKEIREKIRIVDKIRNKDGKISINIFHLRFL
jgi:hypothetical protein